MLVYRNAIVWLSPFVLVLAVFAANGQSSPPRPNIVIMMADDMGFSDLGCYGGEIRTPNLDRLAAGGLRYTQFYNAAKCHTTRASLMSGLWPHQTGCELPLTARATKDASLRPTHSGVSIASVLHDVGYASGKWHAGGRALQRGFDRFYGLQGGACSFFTPDSQWRGDQRAVYSPEEPFYFTDAISDEAVGYLETHFEQAAEQPFFLYVAYTAPHWPMQAYEEDIARYKGIYSSGWNAIRAARHHRQIEMGLIRPEWKLAAMEPPVDWQSAEHRAWLERRMEVYAAMVDRMDQGIGRILGTLESGNAMQNTVIFFLSDNGGSQEEISSDTGFVTAVMPPATRNGQPIYAGNDPSRMPGPENTFQTVGHDWGNTNNTPFRYGKVRVHEGGIASPVVVHWPKGINERGTLRHQLGHVVDLLPTCMELAGASYPDAFNGKPTEPLQGVSLVPTFKDEPLARDTLFFEMGGNRAIRQGNWKAVSVEGLPGELRDQVSIPLQYWELYDIEADRSETNNLAAEHPELLCSLVERWEAWIQNESADAPAPNTLTPEEKAAGFELLFNGRDFEGWKHQGGWKIDNGALAFAEKGPSLRYTVQKIPDDFELRFEWKVGHGSNSGVTCRPGLYEYQILDNAGNGDGKNPRTSAASLYFCMAPSRDATRPAGEWNTARILYKGTVLQHWLNGEKVVGFDYKDHRWADNVELLRQRGGTDLDARSAYLVLQNHGHPIWYRSIKLRTLGPKDELDRTPVEPVRLTDEQLQAEQQTLNWYMRKRESP